MALNLIAERTIAGKIIPALANASGGNYDHQWPYTVPLRLQEYCDHYGVELNIIDIDSEWPANAFYPVGLGFFDFGIDYFELMPERIRAGLFFDDMRVLFYYHEGDNPLRIKTRLDELCAKHNLRHNCYVFVSGNTAARDIPGFVYFTDFELWYYQRNRASPALKIHSESRERDFTILNRLHKSWRALAMADLQRNNILKNSYWSYCQSGIFDSTDCAIEVDQLPGLRYQTDKFLKQAPYESDELDLDQMNNHSILVNKYHSNSYCNIVMETYFDINNSGTFLTEKTFKPIKHGQMFFIAGPAGSLQVLRDLGYRVFDSVLDNSYDLEIDATMRWTKLIESIYFAQPDLPQMFELCRADIKHNQQLFQSTKTTRLNTLIKEINEHY